MPDTSKDIVRLLPRKLPYPIKPVIIPIVEVSPYVQFHSPWFRLPGVQSWSKKLVEKSQKYVIYHSLKSLVL